MRFSFNWLKELASIDDSATGFAEKITMAGLEVDSIEAAAAEFNKIVVGEVVDVQPHPDADRLRVCQVDVAQEDALNIVCGASNVVVGMKVPVALVGAALPCIKKLKASKLRGVKSFGMLCSSTELGLNDDADGLMTLPVEAKNGRCVRALLGLDDACIEVDLTPNRGDCLSLTGLAREAATLYNAPFTPLDIPDIASQCDSTLPVSVQNPEACPRYVGRVIRNVDIQKTAPLWLLERLRRSGIRSISAVVDVTNYVMLELGQPMHAFDADLIGGEIIVRNSQADETLGLLDGKKAMLSPGTLVIADSTKVLALAGIMGGEASSVTDKTTSIFLEAAFFAPLLMAGQARKYGLHTDSSHRFERGVDADLPRQAIERATQLLQAIVGGEAGPVIEVDSVQHLPARLPIALRHQRVKKVLGLEISPKKIQSILDSLGFSGAEDNATWQVTPPGFRFDITIEADIIEEIARIFGYNNLPIQAQQLTAVPKHEGAIDIKDLCRQKMIGRGYFETINYSFIGKEQHKKFFPETAALPLKNPISDAMSVMRTSLWPGLSQALSFNINRQQPRVKLVEVGRQFHANNNNDIQEVSVLAGIATGLRYPEHWSGAAAWLDYFDIKADLDAVFQQTDVADIIFMEASLPCLHPGQSARIIAASQPEVTLGWLGKIHPSLADSLDIPENTFLFECYLDHLMPKAIGVFSPLPKYPSVNRDLAVVVGEEIDVQTLITCIEKNGEVPLISVSIFDVYQGKGIAEDKKSIAFRLTFQDFSRTLTDNEIGPIISQIVKQLEVEHGAKLRDL